jgi:alkylated DNA repair dioxygenase AlkB
VEPRRRAGEQPNIGTTMKPGRLFEALLPQGFEYRPDFISVAEEASLVTAIAGVQFAPFEMRGVVARRRVAFFGRTYDARGTGTPLPIPPFLFPLRASLAGWAGIAAEQFAMALINEYPPGAPIGWHRDAPQYDVVAGVSLLTSCRMKLRPYLRPGAPASAARRATHDVLLAPRSAYLMRGEARSGYEHHIPAVDEQRYSITFRTLRRT